MELTVKQTSIMNVVIAANPDGSAVDIDQLLERLEYETTKQSLQFSLRALIAHGLIKKDGVEKRRQRMRTIIRPTGMGISVMREEKGITVPTVTTPLIPDTPINVNEVLETLE